jgi:two-component system KDP operon response regulator KdpE
MSGSQTILVIDDSAELLKVMTLLFSENGYQVMTAENGEIGIRKLHAFEPDLIILDLSMPGKDGWEVCRQIREFSNVPIIILTAAHVTDEDTIRGLDLGANDYIIKPFKNNVLLARIRNALRWNAPEESGIAYDDGYLKIDLETRQVTMGEEALKLTRKEYEMLTILVQASPRVVSHRQIFDEIWDNSYDFDVNYVRIFVGHLRKKLESDSANPTYVHNERGVGYRFLKQDN